MSQFYLALKGRVLKQTLPAAQEFAFGVGQGLLREKHTIQRKMIIEEKEMF